MDPSFEILISSLYSNLSGQDDERLSGISQLLRSSSWILPLTALKEIKQSVQNLAILAPDLFSYAAILYYAKFIQSIEIENLVDKYILIPQYLQTIEILKNFCKESKREMNFDPFLRIIIDAIKNILSSYESIEKTIQLLNILKKIEKDFTITVFMFNADYNFIDFGIQKYVENEKDLYKSYITITQITNKLGHDLVYSKGSWTSKALKWLEEENKEICDKSFIRNILILLYLIENKDFPEMKDEIIHYCEDFAIDSSEIFSSKPSLPKGYEFVYNISNFTSDFSPIFENHLINHKSQIKLKRIPITILHNNIKVWEGICLFNMKHICVKEYRGNNEEIISLYRNEVIMAQNLSDIESSLLLKYFSNFEDSDSHYIVMEHWEISLKELILNNNPFSRHDLAYFAYWFIKGIYELHSKSYIFYQDIKPENIVIGYDNEFKLINFNISEEIEPKNIKANLEYKIPEHFQCLETREIDECSRELSDVYSLGIVILEMLGSLDVNSIIRLSFEVFDKIIEEQISQIESLWLSNLLEKMLKRDFSERPRFGELLEIIENDDEFMNDIKEYKNKND